MKEGIREKARSIFQEAILAQKSSITNTNKNFHALETAAHLLSQCGEIEDYQVLASQYLAFASITTNQSLYSEAISCYHLAEKALEQAQQTGNDNNQRKKLLRDRAECFANAALCYVHESSYSGYSLVYRSPPFCHLATEAWRKAAMLLVPTTPSESMENDDARKFVYYIQELIKTNQFLTDREEGIEYIILKEKEKEDGIKMGEADKPQKKCSTLTMLSQFAPNRYIDANEKNYHKLVVQYYPQAIEVLNKIGEKKIEDYRLLLSLHHQLLLTYIYSPDFGSRQTTHEAYEQCAAIVNLLNKNPFLISELKTWIDTMEKCVKSYIKLNYYFGLNHPSQVSNSIKSIEKAIDHCMTFVTMLDSLPSTDLKAAFDMNKNHYRLLMRKACKYYLQLNGDVGQDCFKKAQSLLTTNTYKGSLESNAPKFRKSIPIPTKKMIL